MFETSTACHSARGDQKKTTTLPEASTPPRCSTLYGPSGVCQLVSGAAAASVRPQMFETSTACHSARGDQKKTTTLPEASTPPRCSTLYGPSGVCQFVSGAPGASFRPVIADTSTTCQSARGDQKNTSTLPSPSTAPRCSTRYSPSGVCQLVGGPATDRPAMAVTSTDAKFESASRTFRVICCARASVPNPTTRGHSAVEPAKTTPLFAKVPMVAARGGPIGGSEGASRASSAQAVLPSPRVGER